jgi:opacity protein-like surface antigen
MHSQRAPRTLLLARTCRICFAGVLTTGAQTLSIAAVPIPVIDAADASEGNAVSGGTMARAQDAPRTEIETASPYLEMGAGFNFLEGAQFSNFAGVAATGSPLNFDVGPTVTGAVGYAFGDGWRAELEFGYRHSPATDITVPLGGPLGGSANLKADLSAYSFMANAIYGFDLADYGYPKWTPHIGGGLGMVNMQPNGAPAATVFGGQAIAGVEYSVTPILSVGLDYRYVGTTSAGFTFTQESAVLGRAGSTSFNDHSVLFTLRWKIGGR